VDSDGRVATGPYHRGMKITAGNIVRIEFELRIKGGDVVESSARTGPVQYVHGEGKLLPALERRLEGLAVGENLEGEIPATEATPPDDALPKRSVPRSEFPKDAALEIDSTYEAHTANGATVLLRVLAVDEKHVHVRLLPPLAGKDLLFKVKVVGIEDPVSHVKQVVLRRPPPIPAEALHLVLEPDDS
jgi:FKBP-type peptidyl-prolyl cis-trans isomerase 2